MLGKRPRGSYEHVTKLYNHILLYELRTAQGLVCR